MRIIRILVMLLVLGAVIVPVRALAAEAADTNETQTNPKIQGQIAIVDGFVVDQGNVVAKIPYNFEGYVPVKSPDEIKREAMLAKYQAKLADSSLPEGKFAINASAYTAAADECGNSRGITASGVKVLENRTLACPPQFPFGAKVQIDGMGTFVCEDRGGAIKGNHFDIYMQTKAQAFAFGRRTLMAEVIN